MDGYPTRHAHSTFALRWAGVSTNRMPRDSIVQPEKRVSSRAPVVRAALDVRSLLAPIMATMSTPVWPGHTWIQVEEAPATVFTDRTASSYASSGSRYTGEEVFCP